MEDEVWGRQDWDTDASFYAFRQFFLTQRHPRSYVQAYRRYRVYRGMDPEKAKKVYSVPTYFNNWVQGYDSKGDPVPGSLSWAQRAQRYDDEQIDRKRREFERQREEDRDERIRIAKLAREKLEAALLAADPEELDLKEVVAGLRIVYGELRADYDDLPTQRTEIEGGGLLVQLDR